MSDLHKQDARTRRSFLGALGATAAAAVGVLAVPRAASAASRGAQVHGRTLKAKQHGAEPGNPIHYSCCINGDCVQNCGTSKARYHCTSTVPGCDFCTGCVAYRGACYSFYGGC